MNKNENTHRPKLMEQSKSSDKIYGYKHIKKKDAS